MSAGGDPAVGRAPPLGVEPAPEAAGGEGRRRLRLARPHGAVAAVAALDADAARGPFGQLAEGRLGLAVAGRLVAVDGHVAVLVPEEQQPAQRRVPAVPRRRPPHHRLVAGPGEGDVGQAQLLAPPLLDVLAPRPTLPAAAHVDGPPVTSPFVVVDGRFVGRDPARVPQVGAVDDRELQPLAAVDGHHLHRLGVGLQPAGPVLGVTVFAGLGDALAQPPGQRRHAQLLGRGLGVQELADVAQVGEPALAVDLRQHPPRQALGQGDGLQQRGHPPPAQHACPPVQPGVELLPGGVAGGGDLLRRPAQEHAERGGVRRRGRRRALEGLEQAQPLAGDGGGEDAAGAVDHRRHADGVEGIAHQGGVAVAGHQHGDVAGAQGDAPGLGPLLRALDDLGTGRHQPHHVAGQVGGDVLAGRLGAEVPLGCAPDMAVVAVHDAHPQGRRLGGAVEAGGLVGRGCPHRAVGDALVPEAGAAEQGVVGVDQALVAAPVDAQGGPGPGLAGRLQVGVDVGAAEGVDGLLGVADEHEGGVAVAEDPAHDLPLDRVGVLELVDQGDLVALAQPVAGGGAPFVVGQGVAQPGEEIVVGEHRSPALAPLDLVAHGAGQAPAHGPLGVLGRVLRLDHGVGVPHRLVADAPGLGPAEGRNVPGAVEAADVEVVDHLGHQVAQVVGEGDVELDVAGHAQAAEHVLAEPVGGGDGGGVEVGQGHGQVAPAGLDLFGRAGGQQGQDAVVGGRGHAGQGPGQPVLGGDQAPADAVTQLAGGHAGEGDEQEVLEPGALGHVAGGQAGDGEGLAGAGAGLEHRDPGGQGPAHVEGRHGAGAEVPRPGRHGPAGGAHRSTNLSHSSNPSHSRRA